ncbi:MAG TPA: ABC transporter ATP-binding protein [Stellaceae bacterium]|nr:ABC transporter ATP-binding protein [Stellaceae bacterium]
MTEVAIEGLSKTYAQAPVLRDVSLRAASGELVTLLGPSGCGKTTTLRCLAGFVAPDAGEIRVDGASVLHLGPAKRDFGVVFQNYALFPHLSVFENVGYGLRVRGIGTAEIRRRVADALAVVSLQGLEERLPRALSGGQQQRVALARALVIRPRLLLLDEPLANLDARLRQEVRALIRGVQQEEGITAFYVTHDQAEAMAMSDRVAVMRQGRVLQFAPPREIYARPMSSYVAQFTGEANLLPVEVLGAIAPGRYRFAAAAGQGEASGPDGIVPGTRRLLMARPEALSPAGIGLPGLSVTVRAMTFLGAAQQCDAATSDGIALRLFLPPNLDLDPGADLVLDLDPEHAWLMPDEAP